MERWVLEKLGREEEAGWRGRSWVEGKFGKSVHRPLLLTGDPPSLLRPPVLLILALLLGGHSFRSIRSQFQLRARFFLKV